MRDLYSILNIAPTATADQIKRAYRSMAKKYHPDKNSEHLATADTFRTIKEAYETLGNPTKRMAYDKLRLSAIPSGLASVAPPTVAIEELAKAAAVVGLVWLALQLFSPK